MVEFQITMAGICFNITCKYAIVRNYFSEFLTPNAKPEINVTVDKEEIKREWVDYTEYDGNKNSPRWICYEPSLERIAISRKIIEQFSKHSVFLIHGVAICDEENAYLLTAPSGTGKTTRADLFLKKYPHMWILNGDKPLLKVEKEQVIAYGSPWKGKENIGVNEETKLKAIYLIERADNTLVEPISFRQAFDFLLKQIFIPSESSNALRTIQLLMGLEGKVKIYRFASPATLDAVEAAYLAAQRD